MNEAGVGRLLVASLHQGIADLLPTRLEFYESWLNPTGLRDGRIGLAPMNAVLSFLRLEGDPYALVAARAGEYTAEWSAAEISGFHRSVLTAAPPAIRARLVMRHARSMIRSTYGGSRVLLRWKTGRVEASFTSRSGRDHEFASSSSSRGWKACSCWRRSRAGGVLTWCRNRRLPSSRSSPSGPSTACAPESRVARSRCATRISERTNHLAQAIAPVVSLSQAAVLLEHLQNSIAFVQWEVEQPGSLMQRQREATHLGEFAPDGHVQSVRYLLEIDA